jgi:hypothetical protein
MFNISNVETGQLFDWFVSGSSAFALIERLPAMSRTRRCRRATPLRRPDHGLYPDHQVRSDQTHNYAIRYTRNASREIITASGRRFS